MSWNCHIKYSILIFHIYCNLPFLGQNCCLCVKLEWAIRMSAFLCLNNSFSLTQCSINAVLMCKTLLNVRHECNSQRCPSCLHRKTMENLLCEMQKKSIKRLLHYKPTPQHGLNWSICLTNGSLWECLEKPAWKIIFAIQFCNAEITHFTFNLKLLQ